MRLEQAIHQCWAEAEALEALLPSSRLTTGPAADGTLPYAVLVRTGSETALRTSSGEVVQHVRLRLNVYCAEHDAGWAVVAAVLAAFDGADFDLPDGGRVLRMTCTATSAEAGQRGWRMTVEMLAEVLA